MIYGVAQGETEDPPCMATTLAIRRRSWQGPGLDAALGGENRAS
jgi:hypothetical protein